MVKSLEIGDYERTVDNMQKSIDEKDTRLDQVQQALNDMTQVRRDMENELGMFRPYNNHMLNFVARKYGF